MGSKDDPSGSGGRTIVQATPGRGTGEAVPADPTVFYADSVETRPDATVIFQPSGEGEPDVEAEAGDRSTKAAADPEARYDAYRNIEYSASNPIIAAAAPLLMTLGDLRTHGFQSATADELGRQLAGAVEQFDWRAADSGVRQEDARIARYALCETADDIARNLPGIGGEAWAPHSMLWRFYGLEHAGNGFFDALNAVLTAPEDRCDLLELLHACLSLGFEGPYRGTQRGHGLEPLRQDSFDALRYYRPTDGSEISPRWRGMSAIVARRAVRLPLWVIAAASLALVTGSFFWMRATITDEADAVAGKLLALAPTTPVVIERATPAPVAQDPEPVALAPAQIERIRAALAEDIQSGGIGVDAKGEFIVIEIDNRLLFDPGKADTKPEFANVAKRIAAALAAERGPVRVVGHTDNAKPGRSSPYKSNYDLSVARAQAVGTLLVPGIGDASRLVAEGKGEDEPIADNSTPEGRATNRRVDVMLRREETL